MQNELKLPNGCVLRPGCRIRLNRKQAFEIPLPTIENLGLELDDAAPSYDSEVVVWPKP